LYKIITDKVYTSIKPWHALAVLVLFNILIAICIGNKFGEGWDETLYYLYGERSLDAYIRGMSGLALIPSKHIFFSNLRYYGPFYAVIGKLVVDSLSFILKNWSYEDIWHFVNFSFFQGGLISLYIVAKRFMRPWTAFGIVLLFATQPLIFGHAFINPKDIPLMTFFLASVASGLTMVDGHAKKLKSEEIVSAKNELPDTGYHHSLMKAILFGLLIFSIIGKDVISSFIGNLVSFFYYSSPASIWGRLFSLIADRASQLPVESYIHKAVGSKIEQVTIIMILLFVIVKPILDEYRRKQKIDKVFGVDLYFIGKTLIAGLFLGLTTSIRVVGPFAGLLIMGQSLMLVGKKSIPNMIYYFSIAALTTYLTWPFLWDSPTYRFIEVFGVMKNFPFEGAVKFMGNNYAPGNLPWMYLPTLIAIQITEPVIILFVIGLISSIWGFVKNPNDNKKLLIIYSWFMIPVGLFIILHSSAYDNFRQFFFILPPIFILSGIALDLVCRRINHGVVNLVLLVSLAIPGIMGISSLHPYEYIYYNSFVGGTRGAAENFETDYWLTSYREATFYLNANAPIGAKILVLGASYNVDHNARKDLRIYGFDSENAIQEAYDYAVISTRYNSHITILSNAEIVYEVRKNGVLLAVVKKLAR
jgi:hypothetical protein